MIVGIASDTHDNIPKIKKMVEILNERNVDFFLHAGDFVAPFSLSPFDNLKCEWVGVFGNNDGEREGLLKKSKGRIKPSPYSLELSSRKISLMHQLKEVDSSIIVYGHTHNLEIKNTKNRMFLNPGEVCGWLTGKSSLVILDLNNLESEIIYF